MPIQITTFFHRRVHARSNGQDPEESRGMENTTICRDINNNRTFVVIQTSTEFSNKISILPREVYIYT